MGQPESKIENYLVKRVKEKGGKAYKFVSPGNTGVPDRIVVLEGKVFFIELKSETGRPTPLQKKRIAELSLYGATAMVIGSRDDVDALVEAYDNKYMLQALRLLQAKKYGYLTNREDVNKKIVGVEDEI